jgi:hypothetical protein
MKNGITLVAGELNFNKKCLKVTNPLIIKRFVAEEGESFSIMSFCPFQLEPKMDIPIEEISMKVDLTSEKFADIYKSYIEAFSSGMANMISDDEMNDLLEPRTIH